MFDKNQSRIIIILGLLGLLTCVISFIFLSKIPSIEFKFPLEKEKIINAADKFLSLQGISLEPLVKKSKVSSSQEVIIYLQKAFGKEKTNSFLNLFPLYYWQIDYVYDKDKRIIFPISNLGESTQVCVEPLGAKIVGFNHPILPQEYKYLRTLSKREAERIAKDFFNSIDFYISKFRMSKYSAIDRRYIFEWERNIPQIKVAKLKVRLQILGDRVTNFSYSLEIPSKELAKFKTTNMLILLLYLILNILVFALAIFVIIISVIRRKKLDWNFGLGFSLLMLISFLVNFFKWGDYKQTYLAFFLAVTILSGFIYFFWMMIMSSVAKLFAEESGIELFPIKISYSVLLSYVFTFSGFGFTMLFFIFIMDIFNPVTTLGFYVFFSSLPTSKLSCLIPFLLSLGAAVFEEIFFRALMISFLKKYLKKVTWAIILASLVWSFIHISPLLSESDIYPTYFKGVILIPIGILLGYIFIRFGLICAIVTHYLYDLIVIGASFLEFNNFRQANEITIAMLVGVILPLAIVFTLLLNSSRRFSRHKKSDV